MNFQHPHIVGIDLGSQAPATPEATPEANLAGVNAMLKEAVHQCGGHKRVAAALWPDLPLERAANRLRDALNPARRELLNPAQVLHVLLLAQRAGWHVGMAWVADAVGYEAPRPASPASRLAEIGAELARATQHLGGLLAQAQRWADVAGVGVAATEVRN